MDGEPGGSFLEAHEPKEETVVTDTMNARPDLEELNLDGRELALSLLTRFRDDISDRLSRFT